MSPAAAMKDFALVRLAVGAPRVHVANPRANVDEILSLVNRAAGQDVDLVLFPELCLTGYTCHDLFGQKALLDAALVELNRLTSESAKAFRGLVVVGLPFVHRDLLYNCAAVLVGGFCVGIIPKQNLPNYREFYELRHFTSGRDFGVDTVLLGDSEHQTVIGPNLLFRCRSNPAFTFSIEICEDLWAPTPPSSVAALQGSKIVLNPSGSPDLVAKAEYRRELVRGQSARCMAAYAYAGSGVTESTQDLVFGGHLMIAENGVMLGEGKRFLRNSQLLVADVDLDRLEFDRRTTNTFSNPIDTEIRCPVVSFDIEPAVQAGKLLRPIPAHPFVPADTAALRDRCEEVFSIQAAGLAKRIESANIKALNIGVSGGLDSTLALVVAVRACDLVGLPHTAIHGLTMPGFGTTDRTRANAETLMRELHVTYERIDIRQLTLDSFKALGHHPFGLDPKGKSVEEFQQMLAALSADKLIDLVFENVQARLRTFLLMSRGFVVGTGDLSELALGWCTYNGDHMSMYSVNMGVPKTLVKFLVEWAADAIFDGEVRTTLHSIAATAISPELLPVGVDAKIQNTEETIGPYELHDFFLYHMLRFGYGPRKIMAFAESATFHRRYDRDEIHRWLGVFLKRFFDSQFKRSCLPDGPKVGSIALSPRGDWRMPSDAEAGAWLDEWKACGPSPGAS
jgi:NAD+ synthase (glutamine-hydrolysing)